MNSHFDFAIHGAGVAGTMLALRLARLCPEKSILLVDKFDEERPLQTFSFFSREPLELEKLLGRSFQKTTFNSWLLNADGTDKRFMSMLYSYSSIDSRAYFSVVLDEIKKLDNLDYRPRTPVLNEPYLENDRVVFQTPKALLSASKVFTSIPYQSNPVTCSSVVQDFYGERVVCERQTFNPEDLTLMRFSCDDEFGAHFYYLIPYSRTEALVESTLITTERSKGLLNEFHKRKIREFMSSITASYHTETTESGTLPMSERKIEDRTFSSVTNIGIAGGMLRRSTGYSFLRIDRDSKAICEALVSSESLPERKDIERRELGESQSLKDRILNEEIRRFSGAGNLRNRLEEFMDITMLRYLANDTSLFRNVIKGIANSCNADTFARFMCEEASTGELTSIVLSMNDKWGLFRAATKASCRGGFEIGSKA